MHGEHDYNFRQVDVPQAPNPTNAPPPQPTDKERLDAWFTWHPPTEAQKVSYGKINAAARVLAQVIIEETPVCADQSAAIRKVREARMTANAAIACRSL